VTASITSEIEYAKAGTPPKGMDCVSYTGVEACFEKYGDVIWVLDTAPDGYEADASWQNWLVDGSSWVLYRVGTCRNQLHSGYWGYCNKDFYEYGSVNYYGSKGSGLRLWACDYGPCSNYVWIPNNA
jgi:hypothetical protein